MLTFAFMSIFIIGSMICFFYEEIVDKLEEVKFKTRTNFRIPLKQFKQYYKVDPDKWQTHNFHVTYDKKYDIGFSLFDRILYHFAIPKMKQENIRIEFLQDLQKDLADRVNEIRKNTQNELEKIRLGIPKTDVGTQDIERFFEEVKK